MKLSPELEKSLEKVSKEVDSWPAWKRSIDLYDRKRWTEREYKCGCEVCRRADEE